MATPIGGQFTMAKNELRTSRDLSDFESGGIVE